MLFYFSIFYLPFSDETFVLLADTDHYMNSRSVWTPAGLSFVFSRFLDWLYHNKQKIVSVARDDWCISWKRRRGGIWLRWPHVCISIHLHLNFYLREIADKRFSLFVSVQVLRSHVCSCWHQVIWKRNTEPVLWGIISCHLFLKYLAIEMDPWSD